MRYLILILVLSGCKTQTINRAQEMCGLDFKKNGIYSKHSVENNDDFESGFRSGYLFKCVNEEMGFNEKH